MFKSSISRALGCAMDGFPEEAYGETDQNKLRMWRLVFELERASCTLQRQMDTACWIDTGVEHKLKDIYTQVDDLILEVKKDFIKYENKAGEE